MVIVLVLLDPEPVAVRRLTYRLYDSGMTRAIRARCLLDAHWLNRGYRSIGDKSRISRCVVGGGKASQPHD